MVKKNFLRVRNGFWLKQAKLPRITKNYTHTARIQIIKYSSKWWRKNLPERNHFLCHILWLHSYMSVPAQHFYLQDHSPSQLLYTEKQAQKKSNRSPTCAQYLEMKRWKAVMLFFWYEFLTSRMLRLGARLLENEAIIKTAISFCQRTKFLGFK